MKNLVLSAYSACAAQPFDRLTVLACLRVPTYDYEAGGVAGSVRPERVGGASLNTKNPSGQPVGRGVQSWPSRCQRRPSNRNSTLLPFVLSKK
jgi:hypothetical protein